MNDLQMLDCQGVGVWEWAGVFSKRGVSSKGNAVTGRVSLSSSGLADEVQEEMCSFSIRSNQVAPTPYRE